jgi:hypothetical protein
MNRKGLTLVEILVVITIMMILAAIVLPRLNLNQEGRRIREAARMTSTFLGRAKTKAIETGRPCGVMFAESKPYDHFATVLRQVEIPEPYCGSFENSTVQLQQIQAGGQIRIRLQAGALSDGLIRPGDTIQFGFQGNKYRILPGTVPVDKEGFLSFSGLPDIKVRYEIWLAQWIGQWQKANPGVAPIPDPPPPPPGPDGWADDPAWLLCEPENPQQTVAPCPTDVLTQVIPGWGPMITKWSPEPLSFQIFRRYETTIAPPLTLPTGAAVDLTGWGIESEELSQLCTTRSLVVLFSPDGNVSRVHWTDYYGTARSLIPSGNVYLLIGTPENTPPAMFVEGRVMLVPLPSKEEEEQPNWHRLSSRWIGVNPKTGVSVTAENAATPEWDARKESPMPGEDEPSLNFGLDEARQYVKSAKAMGWK